MKVNFEAKDWGIIDHKLVTAPRTIESKAARKVRNICRKINCWSKSQAYKRAWLKIEIYFLKNQLRSCSFYDWGNLGKEELMNLLEVNWLIISLGSCNESNFVVW